jgi:virginiamycin B lyase
MAHDRRWIHPRSSGRLVAWSRAFFSFALVVTACGSSPRVATSPGQTATPAPKATAAATKPSLVAAEPVPHDSVVGLDAKSGEVVAIVPVGPDPLLLTAAGGQIWTLDLGDGALTRIDPVSHEPSRVRLDGEAVGMGSDGADLWVAFGERFLARLDGASGTQKAAIPLADQPVFRLRDAGFLAVADGVAWMTIPVVGHGNEPQTLWKVDAESGAVIERYPIGRDPLTPLVAEGAVWVPILFGNEILRLDLATGDQRIIEVGDIPGWVTAGAGSIWVVKERSGSIIRLSPSDGQEITTIKVGSPTRGIAIGGGLAWAATEAGVTEIDTTTNEVRRDFRLVDPARDLGPIGIAHLDGVVWVSVE